jgi:hypothetical protein
VTTQRKSPSPSSRYFPVLNDKGDEASASEANDPILLGVIVALVFDIGELE